MVSDLYKCINLKQYGIKNFNLEIIINFYQLLTPSKIHMLESCTSSGIIFKVNVQ